MTETPKPYPEDFWKYLSIPQQDLIIEGNYLKDQIIHDAEYSFKDYSFLVFPFAKAYEGFLKQVFLDCKFITHLDYISDHYRVGKMLSPNLAERLGDRSLYMHITRATSREIADMLWSTWKYHRNEIFHYYPHNLKSVTFEEANSVASSIIKAMQDCYKKLLLPLCKQPPLRGTKSLNEEDTFEQWKRR